VKSSQAPSDFPESMEDEAGMQRRGQPNTELATKARSSDPARGRKGDFFPGASTPRPKDPNSTNGGGAQLGRTRDRRRWKPSANESLKQRPSGEDRRATAARTLALGKNENRTRLVAARCREIHRSGTRRRPLREDPKRRHRAVARFGTSCSKTETLVRFGSGGRKIGGALRERRKERKRQKNLAPEEDAGRASARG
jgi:hypothetical protein